MYEQVLSASPASLAEREREREKGGTPPFIGSEQEGQRGLQECWGSPQRWLTSISATIRSDQPRQGVFMYTYIVVAFGLALSL